VRQQVQESPAELPAAVSGAAAPQAWQACLPLAQVPDEEQSEQEASADSGVADFLRVQIDAHRAKLELAVGLLPQEIRLLRGSAFVRVATPVPWQEHMMWLPEIMLLCRLLTCLPSCRSQTTCLGRCRHCASSL
jgi:hypothetical protein